MTEFEIGQTYTWTTADEQPLCGKVVSIDQETGTITIDYPPVKKRNIQTELDRIKNSLLIKKDRK